MRHLELVSPRSCQRVGSLMLLKILEMGRRIGPVEDVVHGGNGHVHRFWDRVHGVTLHFDVLALLWRIDCV
jgi:hypothetical protein